jgi:phage terminase large subunit
MPSPKINATRILTANALAFKDKSKAVAINQGGTSSGKTWAILSLLYTIAEYSKTPKLISIVSESLPHLKRGCIRDLQRILGEAWNDDAWNRSDSIYRVNKCTIEFFGADVASKLRGGRRDILYINEANNIPKSAYDELQVRTKEKTFLDYNPVCEFWAHEMIGRPDVAYIHSTYLDAITVLPPEIVRAIESRRETDPNWWRVYGKGEVGNIEGLCHPYFSVAQDIPDGGARVFGIDFGFGGDPCCLTENVVIGDSLYSDQLIYEKGLLNSQLAARFASLGIRKHYDEIYADSAEPKSIAELCAYGYNVKACPKGADSVVHGIQFVNRYRQHWTTRSLECIKEQRNYRYIEDRDGRLTEKPMDDYNHGMDSRRYAIVGKFAQNSTARAGRVFL